MREMMRNSDRAMSNIEGMPGGFDALRRLYTDIQQPLHEATTNMTNAEEAGQNTANNPFSSFFPQAPTTQQQTNQTTQQPTNNTNTNPLPNPWGSGTGANAQQNPFGGGMFGGGMGGGMGGMGGGMGGPPAFSPPGAKK